MQKTLENMLAAKMHYKRQTTLNKAQFLSPAKRNSDTWYFENAVPLQVSNEEKASRITIPKPAETFFCDSAFQKLLKHL